MARLDGIVALLSLATVVVGLRVVGLVLIVALLVIPPAAARFWSDRLRSWWSVVGPFGAVSAFLGAAISPPRRMCRLARPSSSSAGGFSSSARFSGPARGLIRARWAGGSGLRGSPRDPVPAARTCRRSPGRASPRSPARSSGNFLVLTRRRRCERRARAT